jgi:hypothetical protein
LFPSFWKLTHAIEGSLPHAFGVAPLHDTVQLPLLHAGAPEPAMGAGHPCPHAPQLSGSLLRFTHVPLAPSAAQSVGSDVGHAAWQAPAVHAVAPLTGALQTTPQPPQLSGSFVRSWHEVGLPAGQPEYPPLHA